jgi:U3 small nucleolar RNA-associated protein 18
MVETEENEVPVIDSKQVWYDEDDENLTIRVHANKHLRKLKDYEKQKLMKSNDFQKKLATQFEKIQGRNGTKPSWANKRLKDEDGFDILKRSSSFLVQNRGRSNILPDIINIQQVPDANRDGVSDCVVQSVKFHNNSRVLLTAGFDKTLRLFNINGLDNKKIQSVYFKDLPISTADFTKDGEQVVLSGKKPYFYIFDMKHESIEKIPFIQGRNERSLEYFELSPCNRYIAFIGLAGSILVLHRNSKQLIAEFKSNTHVRSLRFSCSGESLFSVGGDGMIYQWDMNAMKCVHKFFDDGCIKGTAIGVNDDYFVCGSDSGVVNVYDYNTVLHSERPIPNKAIMNLTTFIDGIHFHPDSQMMAMYSKSKQNSLRLVHLPTLRTFSNWPTKLTPLNHVTCMDFNPSGSLLAVGNDRGKVSLFRLNHYAQ